MPERAEEVTHPSVHRAGPGAARIAAGAARRHVTGVEALGGARAPAVGPDGERGQLFAERAAVARGTTRRAVRTSQVLELVTAGIAAVFEDRHDGRSYAIVRRAREIPKARHPSCPHPAVSASATRWS